MYPILSTTLRLAIAVLVMIPALPWRAIADDSVKTHNFLLEAQVTVRGCPYFVFSNFPEQNRHVPLHSDDQYLSHSEYMTEPMADATLLLDGYRAIDICGLYTPDPHLAMGVVYTIHAGRAGSVDDYQRRYQQNQIGTQERGYGMSLRYYQPDPYNYFQLGITGELRSGWIKPTKPVWCRLAAGGVYDLTGFPLGTQGGWDRYDSDEMWEDDGFAKMYEHRVSFTFTLGLPIKDERRAHEHSGVFIAGLSYFIPLDHISVDDDSQGVVIEQGGRYRWTINVGMSFL